MDSRDDEKEVEQDRPLIYTDDDLLDEPMSWDVDDFDDILDKGTDLSF